MPPIGISESWDLIAGDDLIAADLAGSFSPTLLNLRKYLPRDPLQLYLWYAMRALHPNSEHSRLAFVRQRVFKDDRAALARAQRQLVCWGLLSVTRGSGVLTVLAPSATHDGTAELR